MCVCGGGGDVFYVRVVVCDGFSSSRIETQNMRGEKDLRVVVLGFVYFLRSR